MPEIEAQGSECLKEYGGDVGFGFCAPRIFPTICYTRCRANKGAKGGRCRWGEEIEAQGSECLKEYGGDVGFGFCAPRIFPTICYTRCRANKGAKGGRCRWGEGIINVKCLCDYCDDTPR
ncbi:PREDICTED: defensin-like protein 195 [Camelina sativa]|uniref:Defensin-like protein 195 n=1 Tax=Camelina sativa TaxID=90675 RepID=A0ABM1RSJ7_CAMSA|nr:PREDICTED: defensin-like protein 195 [Camelina sativa]